MVIYDKNQEHPSVERIERLRSAMLDAGIDWLIIFTADPHLSEYISDTDKHRQYYSGFTGSAGSLLIGENEAFLFTDSRYHVQAEIELSNSGITLMKEGTENVPYLNDFLKDKLWPGQVLGFDFRTISYCTYEDKIKKLKDVEIVDAGRIISANWTDKPKRVFNELSLLEEEYSGQPASDKINAIRKIIEEQYVEEEESYSYIVSDLCSIMWTLNIRGRDVDFVPVAFSYIVIDANTTTVYLNLKNAGTNVIAHLRNEGIIVREYGNFYRDLENIASDYCLVDKKRTNALIVNSISEISEIKEVKDYELIPKHIKNTKEIEGMISAHKKDAAVMISFIRKIKEAVKNQEKISEFDAGKMLDEMRLKQEDCLELSFETICAYNENAAIVHYSAPEKGSGMINPEGLLLVDSGAHYKYGTTDITRTIVLGEITEEMKKCYTAVLKGNLDLMDVIFQKGMRGDDLDIIARQPILRAGFDYGHGTGHGIGCLLSVHEDPVRISYRCKKDNVELKTGVVVSDEPGIYLEGKFGIRLENALRVTDRSKEFNREADSIYGFDALTLVPFEIEAIDNEMLSDREREILNAYHERVASIIGPMLDDADRDWLMTASRSI